MPHALFHPVRRERKCEPARQGRAARQSELAQPGARCQSRQRVEEDLQDVPPPDEAEHGPERPEEDPVGPAREVGLRLGLRPKAVWIPPRRSAVLQLVADEPVVVQRLQVVARRRLAVGRCASREEVRPSVLERGPRRGCALSMIQNELNGLGITLA